MRTRTNICALLAATALGTPLAMPAMAQDAPAAASAEDDAGDIVVTARRFEERLQDVPISMTVFNQEQISSRNMVSTGDLAIYTPSLSLNTRYGPEKASFIIRGFVQDLATQPTVGVYFADVVAPRSGGSTTSGGGVGVGALFDLQNVQVLKGPQGTLFGRNTTGGAVLLVPQKPTDLLEGYVEGSYGTYDMKRVQAVANIPLADTFKVRLGVDRMVRDGYQINHSGVGPSALANVDYWAARLSMVADLTPDLENYFIGSYTVSDNNNVGFRLVGFDPTSTRRQRAFAEAQILRQQARGDGPWDIENSHPDPKLRTETWQVINTTTWRVNDDLTVKNIASYAEFRETARYSIQGDNFLNPDGSNAFLNIQLNNTPGYNNSSQNTYTEELQFIGTAADGKLKWQAGGYFENSDPLGFTSQLTAIGLQCSQATAYLCTARPATNFGPTVGNVFVDTISQPFQKTWFRSRGLYAQGTYDITDKFAVTAGIRYTWDSMTHRYDNVTIGFANTNVPTVFCGNVVRVNGPTSPANPQGVVFLGSVAEHDRCNVAFTTKSSAPTWVLDAEYKPNDDTMLYAKWSRGYRAGGAATANIYFETWRPEKVDSYEIGGKMTFRGPIRGYLNVAGFYNDFRNQQIQHTLVRAPTSPLLGGSAIINAGKSRIWGFEVDASATLFEGFKVDLGYTYLNTKVLELDPVVLTPAQMLVWSSVPPTAQKNGRLPLSPSHRLTLSGNYTLPLDPSVGKVTIGATYVFTSDQNISSALVTPFYQIPNQHLLNLSLNWNDVMGQPFDLSVFATNVTNAAYPQAVVQGWQSYGYDSQLFNEPRMVGGRIRFRFGG